MARERDVILQKRKLLKSQYGALFSEVEQILFSHDPIEIAYVGVDNVADNPDEYAAEVDTILPRLSTANSAADVTDIVYGEFIDWFGDAETCGPKSGYETLSREIWEVWERFKKHSE